jgi:hypothetical protein
LVMGDFGWGSLVVLSDDQSLNSRHLKMMLCQDGAVCLGQPPGKMCCYQWPSHYHYTASGPTSPAPSSLHTHLPCTPHLWHARTECQPPHQCWLVKSSNSIMTDKTPLPVLLFQLSFSEGNHPACQDKEFTPGRSITAHCMLGIVVASSELAGGCISMWALGSSVLVHNSMCFCSPRCQVPVVGCVLLRVLVVMFMLCLKMQTSWMIGRWTVLVTKLWSHKAPLLPYHLGHVHALHQVAGHRQCFTAHE